MKKLSPPVGLWHKQLSKFANKSVNITIGGKTFKNRVIYFAGTNTIGKEVLTTRTGGIFWIEDWNRVTITPSK